MEVKTPKEDKSFLLVDKVISFLLPRHINVVVFLFMWVIMVNIATSLTKKLIDG